MTNYYLSSSYGNKPNAGSKARNDVDEILESKEFTKVTFKVNLDGKKSKLDKILFHKEYIRNCIKISDILSEGDVLFFQHPIQGAIEFEFLLRKLKKRKVKVVAIVHDLEIFRKWDVNYSSKRANLNDVKILSHCDSVILHNAEMIRKYAEDTGINTDKLVNLEIFDYLSNFKPDNNNDNDNVTLAGNLRRDKSGYIYDLNLVDYDFTLFGIGFQEDEKLTNIHYKGAVDPDKIVETLSGKFGLVWDGTSIETCTGSTGEYLKVNNPHKTSLYLVAGLPVIIWREAALSSFISNNKLGITVSSLNEIPEALKKISEEEYSIMKNNCIDMAKKLSVGHFMSEAIEKSLSSLSIIKKGE